MSFPSESGPSPEVIMQEIAAAPVSIVWSRRAMPNFAPNIVEMLLSLPHVPSVAGGLYREYAPGGEEISLSVYCARTNLW